MQASTFSHPQPSLTHPISITTSNLADTDLAAELTAPQFCPTAIEKQSLWRSIGFITLLLAGAILIAPLALIAINPRT
ncbi:MAG: hypothetical protein AAFY57_12960 [Cyanobacteria bacterium J06642_2]